MSEEKQYTDRDEDMFASLAPKPSGGQNRSGGKVPAVGARTQYTEEDLRKFERMFSEGCAPGDRSKGVAKPVVVLDAPPERHDEQGRSDTVTQSVLKQAVGGAARRPSASPAPGGRIERPQQKTQAKSYSASDIEQFEHLSSTRLTTPDARGETKDEHGLGPRLSYFQELHDATSETISSVRRSFERGRDKSATSASARIRLRYFD